MNGRSYAGECCKTFMGTDFMTRTCGFVAWTYGMVTHRHVDISKKPYVYAIRDNARLIV